MRYVKVILGKLFLFIVLTIATQIGGIVLIVSDLLNKVFNIQHKSIAVLLFTTLYVLTTFCLLPFVAPLFGRERIQHTDKIQPTTFLTVLLNRNYVRPEWNIILRQTESKLSHTAVSINYLDANFPFFDGFPLLPHLSHNDGKKLDLSLIYETKQGELTNKQKSNSGYGVFVAPSQKEIHQTAYCKHEGYFQYDYSKYLTLGMKNKNLVFSEKGTQQLLKALLVNNSINKIFIEPHLKQRLNMADQRIRYHGCHSVRHDDHIHLQLK